jgi:ribosome-associated protein
MPENTTLENTTVDTPLKSSLTVEPAALPAIESIDPEDMTLEDVLAVIRKALDDKKGEELAILDLEGVIDYTDYMVLASGYTEVHNRALCDSVLSELAGYDIIPTDVQGYRRGDWILIDLDAVVVHLFLPALREFYRLEELWSGGKHLAVT